MKYVNQNQNELKSDILEIVSKCVKCRFCFTQCPVYEVSDGWVTQGGSGLTQSLYYGIKFGRIDTQLRDILMRCTTCRSCEIICERLMSGVNLVDAIRKGRELLLEEEITPIREQQKALESLQTVGNPYLKQASKRTVWAEGLELKRLDQTPDKNAVLYFVGCTPSYDVRVQKVARNIAEILEKAGVPFGILEEEKCSGDTALVMGEWGLFEDLAAENIKLFKKAGVSTILTTSPHDYNSFLKDYPKEIQNIKIMHYTNYFSQLLDEEKLSFKKKFERKVTYHDPCYLGKHNNIYDYPRSLLKMVPGLELVEMERNRENSLCCGGGGGRMWVEFDEAVRLAEIRVQEAIDTGSQILATACPFCLINFEDALKVMDKEDQLKIMDVAEILSESLEPHN